MRSVQLEHMKTMSHDWKSISISAVLVMLLRYQ